MSFINGTLKILYILYEGDFVPVGCLTENSFDESSEMLNTTTRQNNGWKTSRPTSQSYSISFSGLETNEDFILGNTTYKNLKDFKRSRTLISWRVDDGFGIYEFGSGYINSLSDSATIDEFASFSGSIDGYGEVQDQVNFLYSAYKTRVEADGGTITSENCQKKFINSIL